MYGGQKSRHALLPKGLVMIKWSGMMAPNIFTPQSPLDMLCVWCVYVCVCAHVCVSNATVTTSAYLQIAASTQEREKNKGERHHWRCVSVCLNWVFWCVMHVSISHLFTEEKDWNLYGCISLNEPMCSPSVGSFTQHVHRCASGGAIFQGGPAAITVAAVNMDNGALSLCLRTGDRV